MVTAAATAAAAAESSPLSLFRRRSKDRQDEAGSGDRILVVGLGNPGDRYAATRHNIGFEIGAELSRRWDLPRARKKFNALIAQGRAGPGGPRVAILLPQTFMNASGDSAGPARGSLKVPLDRTIVFHDEIDLPFGEVRTKLGGGVAGHNGLKSLRDGFGGTDFWRLRAGVGRPESTDPEVVSNYVLSRFQQSPDDVRQLIERAADEAERLVHQLAAEPEAVK